MSSASVVRPLAVPASRHAPTHPTTPCPASRGGGNIALKGFYCFIKWLYIYFNQYHAPITTTTTTTTEVTPMYNPHKVHVIYTAKDGADVSVGVREPSPAVLELLAKLVQQSGHVPAGDFVLSANRGDE